MSQNNDIYSISGRIKNILAKEDIALSPVGNILINYYTLALFDFYNFSDKLPGPYKEELEVLLRSKEDLPKNVIKVANPPQKWESLYEQVMNTKMRFNSNEEALEHFVREYQNLTELYGLKDHEFWMEAESVSFLTEDHMKIMSLARSIHMCKYLINKDKNPSNFFKELDQIDGLIDEGENA